MNHSVCCTALTTSYDTAAEMPLVANDGVPNLGSLGPAAGYAPMIVANDAKAISMATSGNYSGPLYSSLITVYEGTLLQFGVTRPIRSLGLI